MRLLLDQGVPRTAAEHLSKAGIVAEHVGELGLSTAADELILETAALRDAVVVTLDADFHRLLAVSKAARPSVIRVRIEGLKGEAMARILLRAIATVEAELLAGAAVTISKTRIGVRLMPIQ